MRSGGVDTVLAAEANGRTRLVVNVDSLMPYSTKVDGNTITVMLGTQPGDSVAKTAMARASAGQSAGSGDRAIRTIDFRRGSDGTGRVIVQLSDPRTPVNVRQEGNQVVVDFANTLMPKNLLRRYDVMDFATPVQTVDAVRVDGSSRLVITAQGDFEQLAYQSDNQYTVEIKPSVKRNNAEEKKEYTGERLTLNFQDIDVRSVLQLLADTSGQNIVVSDSVSGNLTLRLQNVPWDQALDIVLRTKGLDKRRQDNVIIIGPTEELAAREKSELAARKDLQELAPVRTEFLQVNYAKVADLAKLIRVNNSTKDSMLSARGSLSIDDRTNTLLVQDTADRLADIRRLVQTLDVPIKQVLIEARIVVVSDTFERDLGARFGVTTRPDQRQQRPARGHGQRQRHQHDDRLRRPTNLTSTGQSVPGHIADARQSLPGQSAGGQHGRQHRHLAARRQLPRRSRALGRAERRQGRGHLLAARHHGEPEAGDDPARHRDSVPGVRIERRDDDAVQERRAVPEGHAADHARQPRGHGHRRQRRLRGPIGPECDRRLGAVHRYPPDHHPGAGQRRPDRRARRHSRDDQDQVDRQGALSRRHSDSRVICSRTPQDINNKTELLIFITPKILREGTSLY